MSIESMDTETALLQAIELITRACPADPQAEEVVARIEAIVAQKGCEHFDPAVTDGKLTHLIDVVIDG